MYITGWAVVLFGCGAIAVGFFPSAGTIVVWTAFVLAVVLLDVLLAPSPTNIEFRRSTTRSVRLSQSATSRLDLTNTGRRRMRLLVRDAWQPSAGAGLPSHPPQAKATALTGEIDAAGPVSAQTHTRLDPRRAVVIPGRESARVTTTLTPTRRGERRTDRVTVRSAGPLRLAGRQRSVAVPGAVRVLPQFVARRHLPSRLARLREIDGATSVNLRGAGTEFDSLREYVMGDDVRSIDWRSTARRGDVLVRTWRPERDRRVYIVIDSSRLSAVRLGDGTRLDAQIEAALLLAALAGHAGDRVEVVAVDRSVRARAAGSSSRMLLPTLADQLVDVEPALVELNWSAVFADVTARLTGRALVVLLTALEPTPLAEGLTPLLGQLTRRHQLLVAAARDPELDRIRAVRSTTANVYDAAAAERTLLTRAATAADLASAGVEVVDAAPDDLAPALADRYLALKAAGRL